MRLVLATRNAHKAREFATLLAPHEIVPLPDDVQLPPETGETFFENARDKALAAARATGLAAIADDSGIEAAALGGRPGVRSARFAGEDATDEENLAKLLREAPAGSDLAYVCALVVAGPRGGGAPTAGGEGASRRGVAAERGAALRDAVAGGGGVVVLHAVEGRCGGTLDPNPRGDGGFGYDPAFLPDDIADGRTMAELSPAEKDAISHRGRAARDLLARLEA